MFGIKLDKLARFRVPRELLYQLGWDGDTVIKADISFDGLGIELRKSDEVCAHCFKTNSLELVKISDDTCICLNCLGKANRNLNRG